MAPRAGISAFVSRWILTILCLIVTDRSANAQLLAPSPINVVTGVQGIILGSGVSPGFLGIRRPEFALTQPAVVAHASTRSLFLTTEVNLEGVTLRRGELNPGIYGEGYVDRRHPHTMVHEVILGWTGKFGPVQGSVAAGKGFAPFGTDDPMSRPLVKYPVNHHLAQILERVVGIASLRVGAFGVEVGTFNGDEPISPWSRPAWSRVGDSWAGRATWYPSSGIEVQASRAFVASPEISFGGGLDQEKRSVSVRFERNEVTGGTSHAHHNGLPVPKLRYALMEWADAYELDRETRAFRLTTFLTEAAADVGGLRGALRFERTTRPEDERTLDLFRNPRPKHDFKILGITRWDILTAHIARPADPRRAFGLEPFVEVAHARPRQALSGAMFDPLFWYGSRSLVTVSMGLRLRAGTIHGRMGRYGAASPASSTHRAAEHTQPD